MLSGDHDEMMMDLQVIEKLAEHVKWNGIRLNELGQHIDFLLQEWQQNNVNNVPYTNTKVEWEL